MKKPVKPKKIQKRDLPNFKDDRYLFKLIASTENHESYDEFIKMIEFLPKEEVEFILNKKDFSKLYLKLEYDYCLDKPVVKIYTKLSDEEANDLFKKDENEYKENELKYQSDLIQYEKDLIEYQKQTKLEKIKKLEEELQKLKE